MITDKHQLGMLNCADNGTIQYPDVVSDSSLRPGRFAGVIVDEAGRVSPTESVANEVADSCVEESHFNEGQCTSGSTINSVPAGEYRMHVQAVFSIARQRCRQSLLIDSGSSRNLVGLSTILKLGRKTAIKPLDKNLKLKQASGSELNVLGHIGLMTKLGSREHFIDFIVVDKLVSGAILGATELKSLGAVLDFQNSILRIKGEAINLMSAECSWSMNTVSKIKLEPFVFKR